MIDLLDTWRDLFAINHFSVTEIICIYFWQGPEDCRDKTMVSTIQKPMEHCELQPQRHCSLITKLVPHLTTREVCKVIPKEICVRAKVNPRKIKRPIVKKWCYTPKVEYAESSENDFSDSNDDSNNDDSNNDDSSEDTTLPPDPATASPARRAA